MKFFSAILTLMISLNVQADLHVFAASSMTDAAKEIATAFNATGGEKIRFNFASTGALARQIDAGAPADIFISANVKWMDWLEEQSAINANTRFNLAANTLVLAAPPGSSFQFDGTLSGRVAVGNLKSVPAGIYAQEALEHQGWYADWKAHLIPSSNVRTALLYIQRGEVSAGIVYATDAKAAGLPIIGTFSAESHSPILYPAATVSEKESALQFLNFLKSDKAKSILKQHGFKEI